jgi:hypothetical protein
MKRILLAFIVASGLALGGCSAQNPVDAFRLTETSLQDRQLQSRFYETSFEVELLAAGVGALQDMGYTLDESEKTAGLITASKSVDAKDSGEIALSVLSAVLIGTEMTYDSEQLIKVSFVTSPSKASSGFIARATFQRIVRNNKGVVSRVETLTEPELY